MAGYRVSPQAQANLEDIWLYSLSRWSERQADQYYMDLIEALELLAANPGLGVSLEGLRTGYRKFLRRSHLIIFRMGPGHVEVMRVLHGSMDIGRELDDEVG